MMKHATPFLAVLALCLVLGGTNDVRAQVPTTSVDFGATASSIAEGATGVALDPTITFMLDNPLPDDATLAQFGIQDPEDLLLESGEATVVSSAVSNDRMEVSYELSLTFDSDYALGFWGFEYNYNDGVSPTYFFRPFAVNFTTAESFGDATITGELLLDEEAFPDVDPNFTNALVSIAGITAGHQYLTVVPDASNVYTVDVVRPDSYFIQAYNFGTAITAGMTTIVPSFGYHDGDGDGVLFLDNPLEIQEDVVPIAAGETMTADIEMNAYYYEVGTAAEDRPAVAGTALGANAPNPVRTTATITFHLSAPQPVRLAVYDLLGREVAVLADGLRPPGTHEVVFDAAGLPSGLYLYRLETDRQAQTRSLVVTR